MSVLSSCMETLLQISLQHVPACRLLFPP